jgi:thiamine biosynthesis lipoprotein ApbE
LNEGGAVVAGEESAPVDLHLILYVLIVAPVTFQDALQTALLAMVPQENGWVLDVLSGVDVVMSK